MGRLISDRMCYRNHYMCSGEATSTYKVTLYSLGHEIRLTISSGVQKLSERYQNLNGTVVFSLFCDFCVL